MSGSLSKNTFFYTMPSTLRGRKADYQAKAAKLKAQRSEASAQRETADAHAIMAGLHIQSLQYKLNPKGKKRGGNERTLSTTARMLTSAEGRQLAAEKRTAQLEKKGKEDENCAQRLLADAEVIKRRAELGREWMIFSGTIKSPKRFAANEALKDRRNVDLWTRRRRRAAGSAETEQQQPEDALVDVQNVSSGSGSPSSDVDVAPPLPPPNAPYRFPDSWTPPQPLIHYDRHLK
ncbi:hypothetical protein B0H11DRAFT_2223761 [Mycena galericulata]|nr:hypothetical protein B0H11DRAFT_2223761 [Mycena galericulata]